MPDPMALAASEKDLDEKAQMETTQNRIVEKAMRKRRKKPIQKKAAGLSQTEQMDIMNQNIVDRALKKKRKGKSKKRGSVKKVAADCAARLLKQANLDFLKDPVNFIPGSAGTGARRGGLIGAGLLGVGGALHGALAPGEDEEGEERSRLLEALKRGAGGALAGGVGGAAAGAGLGALHGHGVNKGWGTRQGTVDALANWVERLESQLTDANKRGDKYFDQLMRAQYPSTFPKAGTDKQANLPSLVSNVQQNATYGQSALQGLPTSSTLPVRTDSGNGWSDRKPGGREKTAETIVPGQGLSQGIDLAPGVDRSQINEQVKDMLTPGNLGALLGVGGGVGGALGGFGLGGGLGALYGALAPGEDEEGNQRSRLRQAVMKGLMGAGAGGLVGGTAGALAGGGMGAGMGDAFQANPEGASQVLQTHPDNMAAPPPGQNKVIEAMLPPEYIANRPTTNMLKNLLAGTAVGGLGGAMYGGLAPGRDEEGRENDSLVQAAKYGLLGAGAGALGGGLYGKAHETGGEGGALALEDLGKKHWQKSQGGPNPLPLFEPSRAISRNDRWT